MLTRGYALLGTKLSYAPSLELAVTESTLRRCSASTPSHALALINLLAHRARGVSEMDWRGPFCHASGASQRGGSMPSSLVLLAVLEIQNGSRSISPTMPWGVPPSLQP